MCKASPGADSGCERAQLEGQKFPKRIGTMRSGKTITEGNGVDKSFEDAQAKEDARKKKTKRKAKKQSKGSEF